MVKERVRYTMASQLFNRAPKIMCRAVVKKAVKELNQLPESDGIANNMSTLSMMIEKLFPDYKDLTLKFGAYEQFFEDNNPKNTNRFCVVRSFFFECVYIYIYCVSS